MLKNYISSLIIERLGHVPTNCQKEMIDQLGEFISLDNNEFVFLLKGYAGTGKTTAIGALVKVLDELKIKTILLAPTGRAAKVLSKYCRKPSLTIHKKIYRERESHEGIGKFVLDRNLHKNTIFVVDEASMISNIPQDQNVFGSGYLLSDLIEYVLSGEACKLIITGDTAQLPPVGLNISPALEKHELELFNLQVMSAELTDVVRQTQHSGILANATDIRKLILNEEFRGYWPIRLEGFNDIVRIGGEDLIDEISDCYNRSGMEETIVVTRSNKRANLFNDGIRRRILYKEESITRGDMIMVVKNNYHWSKQCEEIDFIANGDAAEIIRIKKHDERYGFHFADVVLRFFDYGELEIECKIILETLTVEAPSLTATEQKKLYEAISEEYEEIRNKRERWKKIREDPFFNALQIKYAYAVTCHKAQGGQWESVFIDHGYLTGEMIDREYLRWFYTAFTRAESKLYLINFNKEFFIQKE